ncbi:MAG: hypothetical protein H7301_03555 [Cryobacterium sp.]|nr:hypothetical protein [Oligoflexia bacterium]
MSWLRRSWRRLQAGPKFDLPYILDRANPAAPLSDRVEFCENLFDWIRHTGGGKTTPLARIRFLLQLLERKPEWKASSGEVIRSLFEGTTAYRLFYDMGIPHGGTFLREFFQRMIQIVLPISDDSNDLYSIMTRIFYDSDDTIWVETIPEDIWQEVLNGWIFPRALRLPVFEKALADASLALSIQAAALSLRTDFMVRSPEYGMESHPFLHLEANLAVLSAQARRDPGVRDPEEVREACDGVVKEVERARAQIRSVKAHLEETGVSVDLVYQIDRMKLYLQRILFLTGTLEAGLIRPSELRGKSVELFRTLVAGLRYDEDFAFVLKKSTGLLASKIVERTGHTGERYFTSTWKEWRHLFWAAAGGGGLTAITAMMKSFTPHSPAFLGFFFAGMNYSVSFVLMHFLGLKLATKQPSMTAAALADRLGESGTARAGSTLEQTEFVEEVARISRAQFAAVLGNIIFVIPAVVLIHFLWRGAYGGSFYSVQKAVAAVDSVSLWHSGTIVFAAWTGIVLWVSSLGAGFAENFVVYICAKDLIAGHRVLKRLLGAERAAALGESVVRNTVGVTSSVLLGFLLAGTPIFADFFGLPLDVRHVTLTTGTLTFAYLALHSGHGLVWSLLSVAVIGGLNFGVSFTFAILTALRARNANLRRAHALFRTSRRAFWSRPLFFFFPPRESAK